MHRLFCAALILAPLPGWACDGALVMSCTARQGARVVEICLTGGDFVYTYGPPGRAPELSLREPLANGTLYPWQGFGRAIAETIAFYTGDFRYEVSYSVDRLLEGQPTDGSVRVTRTDAEVAFIACDPGSTVTSFFVAADAMADLGLCWNGAVESWSSACP